MSSPSYFFPICEYMNLIRPPSMRRRAECLLRQRKYSLTLLFYYHNEYWPYHERHQFAGANKKEEEEEEEGNLSIFLLVQSLFLLFLT